MVNWNTFENLPGSQDYNFEILSRSLIWLAYSRYGHFRAQLNQPGVEFDLKLDTDCSLGNQGRHFGWQCRWYTISSGTSIGKTRRNKIKESLEKTIEVIPGLTDWVLWTRHTLTKGDQEWFYSLNDKIKLHLWSTYESETLLNTEAEQLKQTYFGELILSPEYLAEMHSQSVAPIKKRWFPEVHQELDAERSILRMLGRATAWEELTQIAENIIELRDEIRFRIATVPPTLEDPVKKLIECMDSYAKQLNFAFTMLNSGEFLYLKQAFSDELKDQLQELNSLPRKLRGSRLQIGILATNAIAELKDAEWILTETKVFLDTRLVGIVADAGGGKTQLSASLTAPQESRPAGVLLLGRFLKHNSSLDEIARMVVINGKPVSSMEALLSALNAAAERAKCILPLVIDGLNEAEDPREWKIHLSSVQVLLQKYQSVLVICTLRSGTNKKNQDGYYHQSRDEENIFPFVNQCLPDNTLTFEIPDFGDDIGNAIHKYFEFFKIEAQPNLAYNRFLRHPLTLRIFCEVSNPTREQTVGMEAVPRSLASLFEKYVELAAERIEEISPFHCRYLQGDITKYLNKLGQLLWKKKSRAIKQDQFRKEIMDNSNWSNSAVNFMEQEGLLLRMPGTYASQDEIIPTYDLLGGYIIAKYIITQNGRDTIGRWLNSKTSVTALSGNYASQHPLRDEVMRFLSALLPQYHNIQLWKVISPEFSQEALELAILLEPRYLDSETISAIEENIQKAKPHSNIFLGRLYSIRDSEKHPLNVNFVNKVLSSMSVGSRDLIWTEWLRRNLDRLEADIDSNITSWSFDLVKRTSTDNLIAIWIMWMLTSTNHRLRHKATLALYWYGRGAAEELFNLAIKSLSLNDPYVPERMLAASYGVAMALASDPDNTSFLNHSLPNFARSLYNQMFGVDAKQSSTHIFIIEYTKGIIELAIFWNPKLFSNNELDALKRTNENSQIRIGSNVLRNEPKRGESPFRMDFENYVIGRLVPGRHNYDSSHEEYKDMRSQILLRIYDLGWSFEEFDLIEKSIESTRSSYNRHDDNDISKTERYGKKYSWIAYFEQKGLIAQFEEQDEDINVDLREMDGDIDPSFPSPVNANRIFNFNTLGSPDMELKEWIRKGEIPDLGIYLNKDVLDNQFGPWILLDGHIGQQDEKMGRSMFGFFRTFFVAKDQIAEVLPLLEKQRLGGRWLPEKRENGNIFAGEIPWNSHFHDQENCKLEFVIGEKTVEVEEEQKRYFLDGKEIDLSFQDELRLSGINISINGEPFGSLSDEEFEKLEIKKELVYVEVVQTQTKIFQVIRPVCDLRTPGKTISEGFTGGSTLNKKLIQMLNLTTIPQTRDLRNRAGERVTFQNSYEKNSFKNNERLFYLRKDLLDSLLEQLGMSMVWAIWGERELSLGQFEVWDRNSKEDDQAYADFQQIHVYK